MKVLALDSASRVCGYAVLTGLAPADLVDAGLLKASTAKRVTADCPGWLQTHLRRPELQAVHRCLSLADDAIALVEEHAPTRIVCEIPSGKAGKGSKAQTSGGALATLGLAGGMVYQAIRGRWPQLTAPVTERQWAHSGLGGGRGSKSRGQADVAALYGFVGYDPARDPGADVADAIALARWWIQRE
jgi:Holliday junction resolvasome RuvABC endonuclease subunit